MEQTTGGAPGQQRVVWKGWLEIGGKKFYAKSLYEKRFALYLEFQKKYKHIADWDYEPETFWFDGIKRGTNNYKPDFKITFNTGAVEYIEVKGYETDKDRTKYKRMAKYHPLVKLRVIGKPWFAENGRKLKGILQGW
jgi:hypothetical protein